MCIYKHIYTHPEQSVYVCLYTHRYSGQSNGRENFPVESVWAVLGLRVSHQMLFVTLTQGLHCIPPSKGVSCSDQALSKTHLKDR